MFGEKKKRGREEQGGKGRRRRGLHCSTPVRKCDHPRRGPLHPSILSPPASSGSSLLLVAGITCSVVAGQFWTVESRLSRLGALLQGLGGAPGNSSRFLPGFVSTAGESHGSERRERRGSTRSRMPVMRGLIAPQNTFLDTIATRFDGTREYNSRLPCPLILLCAIAVENSSLRIRLLG